MSSAALSRHPREAVWPVVSLGMLIALSPLIPVWVMTGMNVYLVALGLIVAFASGASIPSSVLGLVGLYAGILVVGILSGAGAPMYDYLRDVWYVGNAGLTIATGYLLYVSAPRLSAGLKSILVGCLLVSLLQMAPFVKQPDLLLLPAVRIREVAGTGLYAAALGLCVLAAFGRKGAAQLTLSTRTTVVLVVAFVVAVVLSFSRTMVIAAVLCVAVPFAAARGRTFRALLVGGGGLAALLLVLNVTIDSALELDKQSFASKLARSVEELWVSDYTDLRSINENWRGYETSRALKEYADGTPLQWVVGKGFGAKVDLGLAMRLGGATAATGAVYSEVPVLHNGYAYLLVKTGLLGVLGYLLSLALLYRIAERRGSVGGLNETVGAASAVQACVLVLVFTTWVISGAFNKSDLFPFLLVAGYLLGHLSPMPVRAPHLRQLG